MATRKFQLTYVFFIKLVSDNTVPRDTWSLLYRVRQKKRLHECGWSGNNMAVIIYSFNLNISPKVSYGMLECDIVTLHNYMLMILCLRGFIYSGPCIFFSQYFEHFCSESSNFSLLVFF